MIAGRRPEWLVLPFVLLLVSANGASADGVFSGVATDMANTDAVFEAMRERGATELPTESLVKYLEGLELDRDGDREGAVRSLLTAVELDPTFPEPHLALARLRLFREPRTAISDFGGAFKAATSSFEAQHLFLINALLGTILLLVASTLIFSIYITFQLLPRVHHSVFEQVKRWFPAPLAAVFAAAFLFAPGLWRVGLIPFLMILMSVMWPWMRRGEKAWAGTLLGAIVTVPLLLWGFSPLLYSPLDPASRPFLLNRAMAAPYSQGMVAPLKTAIEEHPRDSNLYFALALIQKRGGHFDAAESAYKKAIELGAPPAAVHNNLGVISFLRGEYDDAMNLLQESVAVESERAASQFNLSQTYAKKLYFEKADQALLKANSLSFDRIRTTLRYSNGDDSQTMIDEPLPASVCWRVAASESRRMPRLPAWAGLGFSGAFWLLPIVSVILAVVGWALGRRLYRDLPTFVCTNCSRPVCRRCLRRIRREAYCSSCGDALLRIQSSSYSQLVLDSRIRRNRRTATLLARATAWTLPGFHAVRLGKTHLGFLLCLGLSAGAAGFLHALPLIPRLAWLNEGPGLWWPELPIGIAVLVLVTSGITVVRVKPPPRKTRKAEEEDDGSDQEMPPAGGNPIAA